MTGPEIRQSFLDDFARQQHSTVGAKQMADAIIKNL